MGFNYLKATEPLRGNSQLFTTQFPGFPGTHSINLERMKGWNKRSASVIKLWSNNYIYNIIWVTWNYVMNFISKYIYFKEAWRSQFFLTSIMLIKTTFKDSKKVKIVRKNVISKTIGRVDKWKICYNQTMLPLWNIDFIWRCDRDNSYTNWEHMGKMSRAEWSFD